MRIGYLDCFSGVAGDMWVGALLDAGLELGALGEAVASLQLPGVAVTAEPVRRGSLAATWFRVRVPPHVPDAPDAADGKGEPHSHPHPHEGAAASRPPARGGGTGAAPLVRLPLRSPAARRTDPAGGAHPHRHLDDVLRIVQRATLPAEVRDQVEQVFRTIALAEARVHGQPVETIHFHEVGAVDTIVDVVCAVLGSHHLGIRRFYASAVELGSGTVRCAHGVLPVPAPGTLAILDGVPVRSAGALGERTTPTGAALLKVLVHEFEPRLRWVPGRAGYGAGTRDDPQWPNVLRLTLGEQRDPGSASALLEVSCQLDTATGETLGWLLDALLAGGAVDAFAVPVHMKKGRPGWLLTALVEPAAKDAVVRLLLEESSSLGVRVHEVERAVVERWSETLVTELGPVRCKCARLPSGRVVRRPEADEVERLAREHAMPRSEVLVRLARLT